MRRARVAGRPREPDRYFVDASTCGTTAMYHYLGQHLDVFKSSRKEPELFSGDRSSPSTRSVEEYLSGRLGSLLGRDLSHWS